MKILKIDKIALQIQKNRVIISVLSKRKMPWHLRSRYKKCDSIIFSRDLVFNSFLVIVTCF